MKIAIIILNYNTSADCRKCISYINNQIEVEFEIIVVDNCSQKEDLEILSALCAEQGSSLILSKKNRGYSAGNNIGLRYAAERGFEYAMIINPDMELRQIDYIAKMVAKMSNDHKIAVLGTDVIDAEGQHQNPMKELSFCEEFFWIYSLLKKKIKGYWFRCDYTTNGYCEKLSGCCFMIRMSFVTQIGYLDENTFLYSEEPILAKQVTQQQMKMYYISDLQSFHNHIKSKKGNVKERMKLFNKSRMYYLSQYSGYSKFKLKLLAISKYFQSMFMPVLFNKK